MGPDQVSHGECQVLLIDDICSFLTPRLVTLTKRAGAGVLGVFDPADGPDAKRRLLDCGVSDVIESNASPEEFIAAVRTAMDHRFDIQDDPAGPTAGTAHTIGVAGVTRGVGSTEVALSLAHSLATWLETTLVDLDPVWPSIAPRLDLPLHPNLRTALDRIAHESPDLASAIHRQGNLFVVGGLADRGSAGPPSQGEVMMLLDELGLVNEILVADFGPLGEARQHLVSRFDTFILVASGDPVGLSRLTRCEAQVSSVAEEDKLVVVVNLTPGSRFHASEVRAELASAWPGIPIVVLPYDSRVTDAMWQGTVSRRGAFSKGVGRVTNLVREYVCS